GPSFTVSARERTPAECVELAASLLAERAARICIVTLAEAHKTLANWIGEPGIGEGACTWILTGEAGEFKPIAEFTEPASNLNYSSTNSHLPLFAIDDCRFFSLAK